MKSYYIVSLKHTSKGDSAFTLWRPDSKGYCWYKEWAGIYNEDDFETADEWNVFVEKEVADTLFETTKYDGEIRTVLPNKASVRTALNLDYMKMGAKNTKSCYMSF